MSAETYILIKQTSENNFSVDIRMFGARGGTDKRTFHDIFDAIRYANKLQDEEYIEYGIRIVLIDTD